MWLNASDISEAKPLGNISHSTHCTSTLVQKPLTTHTSPSDQPGLGRVLDVPFSLLLPPSQGVLNSCLSACSRQRTHNAQTEVPA